MLFAMPALGLLMVYVSDGFGDIHKLGKPLFIGIIMIDVGSALSSARKRDGAQHRILVAIARQNSAVHPLDQGYS
jgi:cytochrome b561